MLIIQFGLCVFMCGLIWLVQIVHYPSFKYISSTEFKDFQKFHMRSISYIVMPIMISELVIAVSLLLKNPSKLLWVNFGLLLLTWIFTFILSVPVHKELNDGKSIHLIKTLILTNWPRTILWSIRSILVSWILYQRN